MRPIRFVLAVVFVLASYVLVFSAGFASHFLLRDLNILPTRLPALGAVAADAQGPTQTLAEAWRIIERNYLGALPSPEQRTYGAVRGMVETLGDPYTVFVEPQPRRLERDELRGEFGGIGVTIQKQDSGEIVLRPMPGLAAAQAGVFDGDVLIAVDGVAIGPEATLDDVAVRVRGEVGTTVAIAVRRTGEPEALHFTIRRQRIENPSIEWRLLEQDPATGYVAIRIFNERTARELEAAITDLKAQGMTRLALDLRHNPGGLVEAAIDVTSHFLSDGVVFIQKTHDERETIQRARPGGVATGIPLVILVDGSTASASEIVSGALQDAGRALLIGERTFGKGSVQTVLDLEDGSSVHVTTARWYTPSRRQLDGQGLEPDIAVARATQEQVEQGVDPVLDAALRHLQSS